MTQTEIQWLSVILGLIAAALWLWAAFARVPRPEVPYSGVFRDDDPWIVATDRVRRISKWASILTAAATFFQAVSLIAALSH
jgi:hypothetical protein